MLLLLRRYPSKLCIASVRIPQPRCCLSVVSRRLYSAVTASSRREHIEVPCRSNGSITVDIYHAWNPSSPVVIYLPPGPVLPNCTDEEEERLISNLHRSSAATIARINYRASSTHHYPTPYHDVLFGYDWICKYLLQDESKRPTLARLGVCGQLMGASLATMLALTECRHGETCIAAAAINNPIADWVFPDDLPCVGTSALPEPSAPDETLLPAEEEDLTSSLRVQDALKPLYKRQKRKAKLLPQTAWQAHGNNQVVPTLTMSTVRDVLFRRPEDCFDRFASPIHFFRSPYAQVVLLQEDGVHASQQSYKLLDMETHFALNHYATVSGLTRETPEVPKLARCRAYARNYPPAGTKLSLPVWSITHGAQSPLSDQTQELVKMVRRSIARQTLKSSSGRTRWHDASEKEKYELFAQRQVHLHTVNGVGLWTGQQDNAVGGHVIQQVGEWMKQCLQPDFL